MFPSWWTKIRHGGMPVPMLMAYNSLRILRRLDAVAESGGKMRRIELAAHIREIGNAVVELGYANESLVVEALGGDRPLFESICDARHNLAHDENAVPVGRLAGFFRRAGKLRTMAEAFMTLPEVRENLEIAENYLTDDSNPEISFEFDGEPVSPVRLFGNMDYVALCYAIMIKDIEWKDENRAECGADFITRADMVFALCPGAIPRSYPHVKSGALRKTLLSDVPLKEKSEKADDFLRKGAINAIVCMRELVKAKNAAPLVRELSEWLDRNRKKLRDLRGEFYREWLESGGKLRSPYEDPELAGVYRDSCFRKPAKKAVKSPRP